jgi:hypothetical protein
LKIRSSIALVGLAISFAVPALAQQTKTADPQLRQRLVDVIKKHADAMNNNDAAAAAACFTEDAVYVTDSGPVNGPGGCREVVCRPLPESAFQRSYHHDR